MHIYDVTITEKFASLFYKTNRFYVVMCLFIYKSHKRLKCS